MLDTIASADLSHLHKIAEAAHQNAIPTLEGLTLAYKLGRCEGRLEGLNTALAVFRGEDLGVAR